MSKTDKEKALEMLGKWNEDRFNLEHIKDLPELMNKMYKEHMDDVQKTFGSKDDE